MPALTRTASNDAVNCPARSRTRNREARGAVAEIHQEIADLLGGPGPVRVRGDSENVHVAGADLDDEQAIQAPERLGAVHVEEVHGKHRRGLRVQELPPHGVGAPLLGWGIFRALSTRRIVEAPTRWPSLSSSPWIRWYLQP
jgi:hypothetical protein